DKHPGGSAQKQAAATGAAEQAAKPSQAKPTPAPAKAVATSTAKPTAPPQLKPSIAQQRAMVSPHLAAIAHKSSTEYLSAAGWQRQASGPDGTTWNHPKFGEVTLAKDGWLQLPNDVKVRPERVGLYLRGLDQGTATTPAGVAHAGAYANLPVTP